MLFPQKPVTSLKNSLSAKLLGQVGARQLGLRDSGQTNYASSCLAPTPPQIIEMIPYLLERATAPLELKLALTVVGLFWLIGLLVLGCAFIQIVPPHAASAANTIIFATVTPAPLPALGEIRLITPTPNLTPPPALAEANELGKIMILEYHRITAPQNRYQRTPENFRADVQRLYQAGYYPVNFIDILRGLPELPPGTKPVGLTFDDSDITQFQVLEDSTIAADSAMGILLDFHNQHPAEWPLRATFFILANDTPDYHTVFGQPEWAKAKLKFLVESGMEVGSHTVNHVDLSVASAERIYWELAISKHIIEEVVPGYTVESMSVPYGGFPYTLDFLQAGQWGEFSYSYTGNAAAWGGATVSPFDKTFEPYKVSRIEVTDDSLNQWLTYFEQNPHEYYVSDGNPQQVTAPELLAAE